jgi:hypothetical protein
MSDFDAVLERLVTDQAFAAALAADPAAALAGYRLDPDEVELLHSQVGGETGGQHAVEVRTNQSSLFGMLSPLVGMAGALPSLADNLPGAGHAGSGAGEGMAGQGGGYAADGPEPAVGSGFGPAGGISSGFGPAGTDGFGAARAGQAGFGPAGTDGFGGPPGHDGFGPAGVTGHGGFGPAGDAPGHDGFGPAESPAQGSAEGPGQGPAEGPAQGEAGSPAQGGIPGAGGPAGAWPSVQGAGPAGHLFPGGPHQGGGGLGSIGGAIGDVLTPGSAGADPSGGDYAVPEGYHAGLDLDGDGRDDEHILRGRADGGVDILVDRDGDGQVDIIGHDDDADGHVESADYDKDGDGHFERTRHDDDGDGWLDRTVLNEEGQGGGPKAEGAADLASIAKHLRMS